MAQGLACRSRDQRVADLHAGIPSPSRLSLGSPWRLPIPFSVPPFSPLCPVSQPPCPNPAFLSIALSMVPFVWVRKRSSLDDFCLSAGPLATPQSSASLPSMELICVTAFVHGQNTLMLTYGSFEPWPLAPSYRLLESRSHSSASSLWRRAEEPTRRS